MYSHTKLFKYTIIEKVHVLMSVRRPRTTLSYYIVCLPTIPLTLEPNRRLQSLMFNVKGKKGILYKPQVGTSRQYEPLPDKNSTPDEKTSL